MHVEFKNSLENEARAIFIFFRDPNSPHNWFWIPNISSELTEKIKKAENLSKELSVEIEGEIQIYHTRFKPMITEKMEEINSQWPKENFLADKNKEIVCWLCLFLPGGLFNYRTNEIFAGINRSTKNLIKVVKHEILHLEFWEETKNMTYQEREKIISEKLK